MWKNSPFDTCCIFLVFGLPWSIKVKSNIVTKWNDILAFRCDSAACLLYQYLVLWCTGGQALDLWSQLNEHVSYGGNPRVEVFVFIVLCTEILLVPLALLKSHDGTVHAAETRLTMILHQFRTGNQHFPPIFFLNISLRRPFLQREFKNTQRDERLEN